MLSLKENGMKQLFLVLMIILTLSACSGVSTGVHINSNGQGGVQMRGSVLSF